MIVREFHIEQPDSGTRLDHFLAEQVPELSRSRLQALIKESHVTLNGSATRPNAKLRPGDRIALNEPRPAPSGNSAEDIALDVLFEDEDLIVVNKAAGMVVHPAVGHANGTLVNALLHRCGALSAIGGIERPGIVHRLDKETSGCLVAAKSDATHQALTKQFAGREVEKIYLALASGRFSRKQGEIETQIGRHPVHRQKMSVVEIGKGRDSRTSYRVLAEVPLGSLVECTLHTGRTHQIRVHLKHLGHPLLGDEVYGKRGNFPRQMLHAWKLGFTHPRTGKRMHFVAPIPEDLRAAGASSLTIS